jgi:hypothetical protein
MIIGTVRSMRVLRRASIPENLAATLTFNPPRIPMLKPTTVCARRKRKIQFDAKSKTRLVAVAGGFEPDSPVRSCFHEEE